jgi:cysteine-rich repeat protein
VIGDSLRTGGRRDSPRSFRLSRRARVSRAVAVAALCGLLIPAALHAHGVPTPLTFWGDFGRRIARCQRVIGRSAAVCGLRAWEARRACRLGTLRGLPCDEDAADAAVEAAHLAAGDAVANGCTEQQVVTLVFLGSYEAQSDVVRFCRELEAAAVSAVFLPVAGSAPPSPQVRACVDGAALATTKLLRRAFDSRQLLLDRIALEPFSPPRKQAMVAASTAAIGRDAATLADAMAPTCSADAFAATYGRSVATFLSQIASRADCLAGQTYAQGGILCPAASCGNAMRESGEECDDGNQSEGDGCSPTCTRE